MRVLKELLRHQNFIRVFTESHENISMMNSSGKTADNDDRFSKGSSPIEPCISSSKTLTSETKT